MTQPLSPAVMKSPKSPEREIFQYLEAEKVNGVLFLFSAAVAEDVLCSARIIKTAGFLAPATS